MPIVCILSTTLQYFVLSEERARLIPFLILLFKFSSLLLFYINVSII